jgi:hypothetical protein
VERLATQEKCVVYSFGSSLIFYLNPLLIVPLHYAHLGLARHVLSGINGESSFEAALLERAPGCEVWGYDFTVDGVSVSA